MSPVAAPAGGPGRCHHPSMVPWVGDMGFTLSPWLLLGLLDLFHCVQVESHFAKNLCFFLQGLQNNGYCHPQLLFSVDSPCKCIILDTSAFLPCSFRLRGFQVRLEGLASTAEDLDFPGRCCCVCRGARDPEVCCLRLQLIPADLPTSEGE